MVLKQNIAKLKEFQKNAPNVEFVNKEANLDTLDDWYLFKDTDTETISFPKNFILYGPPGTGKTYHTVLYAVAIIEKKTLAEVAADPYEDVISRYHQYQADGFIAFTTFHQSYGYEEFIEGIRPVLTNSTNVTAKTQTPTSEMTKAESEIQHINSEIQYEISSGIFKSFCDRATQDTSHANNYVFIIDEINRGNLSKIFGELITLIEPSKRLGQIGGITVTLPYSKTQFGVPDNLYLIGTMNTADRSIALLDTALRRRFQFRELQPDPSVLNDVFVEDLSIKELFTRMNQKISILFDREHTIGHAYFLPLKENPTLETLASTFRTTILPLLQEYFYEDYEKIQLILGDNKKAKECDQFIIKSPVDYAVLFGSTDFEIDDSFSYQINIDAFTHIDAYRSI